MRRLAFLIIICSVISAGHSRLGAQSVKKQLTELAQSDDLKSGRLAMHAVNVTTGELVASLNPDMRMTPASNLKLLTTYAAVDILGADHHFETRIALRGGVVDGRLMGDVVIEAGGDPTLGSKYFAPEHPSDTEVIEQIAQAIKAEGVSSIHGRIVVDGSVYSGSDIAKGYSWEDIGNYYAAGATALTFRDNRFSAFLKSGAEVGGTVELQGLEPSVGIEVDCETKAASISSDQAYFYLDGKEMVLRGEIPLNKSDYEVKGALPDPAGYFVSTLSARLIEIGISIEYGDIKKVGGQRIVHRIISPPLIDIVAHTNMHSDNLFADHLLRQIGLVRAGEGSFDAGIEELEKWMRSKDITADGLKMKDGSGLSATDRVTARMLSQAMQTLRGEDYYRKVEGRTGFLHGLPVAGESGSMRRIGKGTAIAGKMRAKTGYIDGVRAYTGAVVNGAGEVIVFSLIANDYACSASEMRKKLAELLVLIGS